MKKISIICCYNNYKIYKGLLVESLKEQLYTNYELIGIDNTENRFKSASEALNYGIAIASGDWIIAVHQDFEFVGEKALEIFSKYLENICDKDVIGVAGAVLNPKSSIKEKILGRNRIIYSSLLGSRNQIGGNEVRDVCSLDECCIGFRKKFWERHRFDEVICNKWDLYAVEYCLYAQMIGGKSLVIPVPSTHYSGGKLGKDFYIVLRKLSKKYCKKIKLIITTCIVTNVKMFNLEYIKLTAINKIRKLYLRKK